MYLYHYTEIANSYSATAVVVLRMYWCTRCTIDILGVGFLLGVPGLVYLVYLTWCTVYQVYQYARGVPVKEPTW